MRKQAACPVQRHDRSQAPHGDRLRRPPSGQRVLSVGSGQWSVVLTHKKRRTKTLNPTNKSDKQTLNPPQTTATNKLSILTNKGGEQTLNPPQTTATN